MKTEQVQSLRNLHRPFTSGRRFGTIRFRFYFLFLSSLVASQVEATTWHVPSDYSTIKTALAVASAADTVLVACGEYFEYGLEMKSGVVLRSELGLAGCAIIDAEGKGQIITCMKLSNSTRIEGFTFRNGFASDGGAIGCIESDLTITNCLFTANLSHASGGGFSSMSCGPTLEACVFVDNHSLYGGGSFCSNGNPTFIACAFVANTADVGGGLLCDSRTFAKVVGCVFSENVAQAHGGGVSCLDSSSGVFQECLFQDNSTGTLGGGGGAMSIVSSSPHLMHCTFSGNYAAGGGAVFCVWSPTHLTYCRFTGNRVLATGSAMYYDECDPLVQNCTFVEDESAAGATIYTGAGSTGRFERCIIAFGAGRAVECYPRIYPSLQQCNIFGNQGGDWTGNISAQADSNGNLSIDPMFCDFDNGDFSLCEDSPCLPANTPEGVHIGATWAGCDGCGANFTAVILGADGSPRTGQGVNLIDWDRDGDLDAYIVNYEQPNQLWENRGEGSFQEVASGLLSDPGASRAAAWADYDNDGHWDLYLSRDNQANSLLRNEGGGSFSDVTDFGLENPGAGRGISWADFDRDGLLDLYLVNHSEPNILFKNFGDLGSGWLFLPQSGVVSDDRSGVCAAWSDFDLDGDLDLYVTNQYEPNILLRNDYPLGFFDESGSGALADYHNGQGVAWGDYDNNGYLDLFLANDGQEDRLFKCSASGLALITGTGLGDGGNGRGVTWGDFDNDGDLDLYLARYDQQDLYYENLGNGQFEALPVISSAQSGFTNAVACGDLDGDGDLDLCLVQENDPDYVLLNDLDTGNHWLQVKLAGTLSNSGGVGAHLRLTTAGLIQIRQISCGTGHNSQNPPWAHFGLGQASTIDTLVIHWPSGIEQVLTDIAADRTLTVVEMEGSTPVENTTTLPLTFQLYPAYPNPFNPATTIAYDLPQTVQVHLDIYDLAGRLVIKLVPGEQQPAGHHSLCWNGRASTGKVVAAGVYTCHLQAGSFQQTQRLVLVK